MNLVVTLNNNAKSTLKELSKEKGLMLCFLDMKEPSKHILQDLPLVGQALNEWGGGVLFLTPDRSATASEISSFKGLPQNTSWAIDKNRELLTAITSILQIDFSDDFPLTLYLSRNGGILYSVTGYRIGTGDDILKIIRKEEKR
jgi:hypothetical protein